MTRRLVVVGHGMVAHRLVEQLRLLDRTGDWHIVVLAEETRPAYDRIALTSYLTGRALDELTLPVTGLADMPPVELRLGHPAAAVDPVARVVHSAAGETFTFDALVLATGARPFVPPVPGHDLAGCFGYRTFEDVDAIRAYAAPGHPAVVVGGGLLGLEAANGLRLRGLTTTVVENAPHLMPAQLDAGAARVLSELVTGLGLHVRCPDLLAGVEPGPGGSVAAVRLADGSVIPARLVVFAAGVRARDDLATGGLARGDRGGFLVDEFGRTPVAGIWAVGDCAAVQGRCHGLVAPGYRLADSVARQLAGLPAGPFDAAGQTVNLKLAGIRVVTVGQASAGAEDLEIAFGDSGSRYAKVVLTASTGRVLGGLLVGDTAATGTLRALVDEVVPDRVEQLLLPDALRR